MLATLFLSALVFSGDGVSLFEQGRWGQPPFRDVLLHEDLAICALDEAGVQIFDIRDPAAPVELAWFEVGARVQDMAVHGDNLLIGHPSRGLVLVDIGDPSRPRVVGNLPRGNFDFKFNPRLLLSGSRLFEVWPRVIDVHDLESGAKIVASWDSPSSSFSVSGDLVAWKVNRELVLQDISDLAQPRDVGRVAPNGTARTFVLHGSFLFVFVRERGLQAWDLADPGNPRLRATVRPPSELLELLVHGDRLFARGDKELLHIFDITDPANPSLVATDFPTELPTRALSVSENRAAVVDGNEKLVLFDLDDSPRMAGLVAPTSQELSYLAVDGPAVLAASAAGPLILDEARDRLVPLDGADGVGSALAWSGPLLLAAGQYDLRIFDFSNPGDPILLGTVQGDWYPRALAIAVEGDHCHVLSSLGLSILDISDASNPTLLTRVPIEELTTSHIDDLEMDVDLREGHAFICGFGRGLQVFDVREPGASQKLTEFYQPFTRAMDFYGDYGVLALDQAGIMVVDLSDPVRPRPVGSVCTPGRAMDVVVRDRFALVADGEAGIAVVDLSRPHQPVLAATYPTVGKALAIGLRGNSLWIADGPSSQLRSFGFELPSLSHVMPWIVNEGGYQSRIHLANKARQPASVFLRAVDETGHETLAMREVGAGGVLSIAADELFPGMASFSLELHSDLSLFPSAMTWKRGGNEPLDSAIFSQGRTWHHYGDKLVLGNLPATGGALVFLSNAPAGVPPVRATVTPFGGSGGFAPKTIELASGRPSRFPIADFIEPNAVSSDISIRVETSSRFKISGAVVGADPGGRLALASADAYRPANPNNREVETIGEWGYGLATDLARHGGFAYVATLDEELLVIDARDAQNPEVVRRVKLPFPISEMAAEGGRLYAAGFGLAVYDLERPEAPRLLGSEKLMDNTMGLAIHDHWAYLSLVRGGVAIFETKDGGAPRLASLMPVDSPLRIVAANGLLLLHAYWNPVRNYQLQIFSLEQPDEPQLLSAYALDSPGGGLAVQEALVYQVDNARLVVLDISDPTRPAQVGQIPFDYARRLHIVDGMMFAAWRDSWRVLDLVDPLEPRLIGSYSGADELAPSAADLFSIGRDFSVWRIDDPSNAERISQTARMGVAQSVTLRDGLAYLAHGQGGLRILDVRDPQKPFIVGELPLRDTRKVLLDGDRAYVADSWEGPVLVDIKDPARPEMLSKSFGSYDVLRSGSHVYASSLHMLVFEPDELQDYVGSWDPRQIDSLTFSRLAVLDETLFMTLRQDGLTAIDVGDPTDPRPSGYFEYPAESRGLAAGDGVVYLADRGKGLLVLDVANPQKIRQIGAFCSSGEATSVALREDRLYLADGHAGVKMLDVSRPSSPRLLAEYATGTEAQDVWPEGDTLYVAGGYSGRLTIGAVKAESFSYFIPWMVANDNFGSGLSLANPNASGASVSLRIEDLAGQIETRELDLRAGATMTADAASLFPDKNGYALAVESSQPLMVHFFTAKTSDAAAIRDGARGRAVEASLLSRDLLFEVVRPDPRAAVVLVAPGGGIANKAEFALYDEAGGLVARAERTLVPNRPNPIFLKDLFGVRDNAATLRIVGDTRLAGTLFFFGTESMPVTLDARPLNAGE